MRLTPEQLRGWEEQGYLVVPDIVADPARFVDDLAQPPTEAATAAGLNRHQVDPVYGRLATLAPIVDVVRQLLGTEASPRILQTMYLNKTPENSIGISLHQDTHYIPNTPNTLLACWLALTVSARGGTGAGVGQPGRGGHAAHCGGSTAAHVFWPMMSPEARRLTCLRHCMR